MANKKTALKRAKKEAQKKAQMQGQGPFIRPSAPAELKPVEWIDLPATGTDDDSK